MSGRMFPERLAGCIGMGRTVEWAPIANRPAMRMRGLVSLDNNGGFLQASLNLAADGATVDISAYEGIEVTVLGNNETYNIHLRTSETSRPWQSYRHSFIATQAWCTLRLPFSEFTPHRIDVPLDTSRVRRIGLVAIGRAFEADLSISGLQFYSARSLAP
jgi:hypothetical protein